MSDCGCKKCGPDPGFDARAALESLNRKFSELSDTVIKYMSEAHLERPERIENAHMMAENLMTVVGGTPTVGYPECCFVDLLPLTAPLSLPPNFCTGVLIRPGFALTAAHCSSVIGVRLNCDSAYDQSVELLRAHPLSPGNPRYDPNTGFNDIRILPLHKLSLVQWVPIATAAEVRAAGQVTVVGFGEGGNGFKQEARNLRIRSHAESDIPIHPQSEFLAGGGGRGACFGDSGGPAYIVLPSGQRKLAGLYCRHIGGSCGDGGIYTLVDAHRDWIRQVAKDSTI